MTNGQEKIKDLLSKRMIEALSDPETATPGVMQAALRFLSDNQGDAVPEPGSAIDRLMDQVPFKMTGTDD